MMTPGPFILFLDFDGVLHGDARPHLERLPLLEDWLRMYPRWQVVISSTWREEYSMEALIGKFAPDLQHRIIGGTPRLPGEFDDGYVREDEINAWLAGNDLSLAHWVAVDDMDDWFTPRCPNLVLIDPEVGLQPADLIAVVNRAACLSGERPASVQTVLDLFLVIRADFPAISARADQLHAQDWGERAYDEPYSWFESLADVANAAMKQGGAGADWQALMADVEARFLAGTDEIKQCIDVAFVENLFWQVPVQQAGPWWRALPAALKGLYLGFHGRSPA